VPRSERSSTPRSRASATYSASSHGAVALMVIDVFIRSIGMPFEQRVHVVERGDRHTDLAELGTRDRIVGVVAALGRQVERDR